MKINTVIQGLLLGTLGVGLLGCASSPISKDLRQRAKPLTWAQVAASPGAYTGTVVIWGGRVIQTINETNGASLYVLQLPLDWRGVPEWYSPSSGRLIARTEGYLDPEVFRQGRLVTLAGAVAGATADPLQQTSGTYPVVAARELHLWRPITPLYDPTWSGECYTASWGWDGPRWNWYGWDLK